jgi:hypothetical protein
MLKTERRFELAVQIAAGFVSNGDIRLHGAIGGNSMGVLMLGDLIPTLYEMLESAEEVALDHEESAHR